MAPTEFLAIQHYQRIMGWLDVLEDHERPRVALLTGSIPTAKARVIRSVRPSFPHLAVHTHVILANISQLSLRVCIQDANRNVCPFF
jgi:RecG-like helicase